MADQEITIDCKVVFSATTCIHPRFTLRGEYGRTTLLFGPSGCGKTTSLRLLAGLVKPETGYIRTQDAIWSDTGKNIHLSPQQRKIGFLFQSYALFPHLSVHENLRHGIRTISHTEQNQRIHAASVLLKISNLLNQHPPTLSGGQAQRVALARTLVTRPQWLFLDEPLSALDEPLRADIGSELRALLRSQGIPNVIVTHDRRELGTLGDDIIIMNAGQVIQQGPVTEVLHRPSSLEAARILGFENILPVTNIHSTGQQMVGTTGTLTLRGLPPSTPSTTIRHAVIRAESIIPFASTESVPKEADNIYEAKLTTVVPVGPLVRMAFQISDNLMITVVISSQFAKSLSLTEGNSYRLFIPCEAVAFV